MNPLDLFYSWQALILAAAVSATVQFIKVVIDTKMGVTRRQANVWLNRVALPGLGLVIGAIYANIIPLRPEVLIQYNTEHLTKSWEVLMSYGAWGAAVGQFADYVFTKLKKLIEER